MIIDFKETRYFATEAIQNALHLLKEEEKRL
jgi:hypothetical protein